ncbi:NAD(P)-binding domain-containing protein [Hymenobacter sp. BT635]|uniref:NAD(P)-binding domain-containing protein n=1 Tax=Hymenobacter nitidus TaxID=2880929 RepID=A0ABS8AID1_9BACT|nr:NAD(P)-binding domain-containing protein [Hymenobacter nitidus]MCB2378995.1 NAD(P)-binding domain-containing protein [Hymenobacter nitidus]
MPGRIPAKKSKIPPALFNHLHRHVAGAGTTQTIPSMNIGIIGAGHIGSALAVRLTSLGHTVYIANSRGPETLTDVAQKTGATAVMAQEAAQRGTDLLVVTIPLKNIPDLPQDLLAGVPAEVPIIDTSNYYPLLRDGQMPELETGDQTESGWVQQHLGRPVVKVFNNILADHLENNGQPAGTPGRIGLPVASDDAAAKQKVMALVEELGFDAVDGGTMRESWRQQPGGPIYCNDLPADQVKEHLTSLGTERTEAQHAEFLANHAQQEQAMAAQGISLK